MCTIATVYMTWQNGWSFLSKARFGRWVLSSPVSVYLSGCLCVYQSLACPHDKTSAIQVRITKFGTEVQNTLVKIPIIWWDGRPWSSRTNLTWKSNFTSFWACLHPFKLESPNLDQKCILVQLRSLLINLRFNFIFNRKALTYLRCFVSYLARPCRRSQWDSSWIPMESVSSLDHVESTKVLPGIIDKHFDG